MMEPPCTDKRVFAAQRDGERSGKPSITELGSKRVENTEAKLWMNLWGKHELASHGSSWSSDLLVLAP